MFLILTELFLALTEESNIHVLSTLWFSSVVCRTESGCQFGSFYIVSVFCLAIALEVWRYIWNLSLACTII